MARRPARRFVSPLLVLVLAFAFLPPVPAGAQECTPGQDGCLPTSEQCATGEHNGVTLGPRTFTAAVCVGAGGTALLYAGGDANPTLLCGEVVVGGQVVSEGDPNACADLRPMFPRTLPFRVVLPADYARSGRRYPVLYLLAGGGHDENSWLAYDPDDRKMLHTLANRGVIIVSVFTGLTFHTNWLDGRGDYETDFVRRLVPTIDRRFRTVANRSGRAIAGFSMGAYGALILPAHHPDLFSVIGGFSTPAETTSPGVMSNWTSGPITALGTYDDPVASPPWGDPATQEVWWRDANPGDLAAAYRDTSIWLSVGNGVPTSEDVSDSGPFLPLTMFPETELLASNLTFTQTLDGYGFDYEFRVHDGAHNARHAAKDLRDFFPWMLEKLGRKAPREFSLKRATPAFGAYGWTFRADPRRAPEFLDARAFFRKGLMLNGSGRTLVTTGPLFRPGQQVRVVGAAAKPSVVRADRQGRLTFTVDLGEPHGMQEYTPEEQAAQAAGVERPVLREIRFTPL